MSDQVAVASLLWLHGLRETGFYSEINRVGEDSDRSLWSWFIVYLIAASDRGKKQNRTDSLRTFQFSWWSGDSSSLIICFCSYCWSYYTHHPVLRFYLTAKLFLSWHLLGRCATWVVVWSKGSFNEFVFTALMNPELYESSIYSSRSLHFIIFIDRIWSLRWWTEVLAIFLSITSWW